MKIIFNRIIVIILVLLSILCTLITMNPDFIFKMIEAIFRESVSKLTSLLIIDIIANTIGTIIAGVALYSGYKYFKRRNWTKSSLGIWHTIIVLHHDIKNLKDFKKLREINASVTIEVPLNEPIYGFDVKDGGLYTGQIKILDLGNTHLGEWELEDVKELRHGFEGFLRFRIDFKCYNISYDPRIIFS